MRGEWLGVAPSKHWCWMPREGEPGTENVVQNSVWRCEYGKAYRLDIVTSFSCVDVSIDRYWEWKRYESMDEKA